MRQLYTLFISISLTISNELKSSDEEAVKYDIEYISRKEFEKNFDAVNFQQFQDIQEFLFQFFQFNDRLLKRDIIETG